MRVLPLLFVFAALSLRPALAQPSTKEAVATPIRYSRDVPHPALRLMPRGAKSLFWGTFSPKKGSGLMAIHLFALRPRREFSDDSERELIYHFALDVFVPKSKMWRRINRVPVTYSASLWGSVHIKMRLFWLNQKEKVVPALVFDAFTNKVDYPGPPTLGDGVFVTFPQGWMKPAQVDSFAFGPFSDGNHGYEVETAADGQLQVETSWNEPSGTTKMIYRWNGHEFFFVPGTEKTIPLQP